MKEILRVEDVAAELDLTENAVRQLIRQGRIPAVRIGRRWYCRREALIAMFHAKENARAASKPGEIERLLRLLPPSRRRAPKKSSPAAGV